MGDMEGEIKILKRYLLGSLPEEEMQKIDLQVISDPKLEEGLHSAENELMEDYLENMMSTEETGNFEAKFLINEERRGHLEFLRLLKKRASEESKVVVIKPARETVPFSLKIKRLFTDPRAWPVAVAAALVLLALPMAYFVMVGLNDPTYDQIVQMNRRDLSDMEVLGPHSTLNPVQGTFRGGGNKKLDSGSLSETVLVRLSLPGAVNADAVYNVKLLQNSAEVLALKDIRVYSNGAGQEVRLVLLRKLLKKGAYQIELSKENDKPLTYSFTLE